MLRDLTFKKLRSRRRRGKCDTIEKKKKFGNGLLAKPLWALYYVTRFRREKNGERDERISKRERIYYTASS